MWWRSGATNLGLGRRTPAATPGRPRPGWFLGVFLSLLLLSCQTIENRIEENPELFRSLSPQHQQMILNGQIGVGFRPEEVYLAWGPPSHKALTESSTGRGETWIYTVSRSDTYYRTIRRYDREKDSWIISERPHHIDREYLTREAVFREGVVESLTIYPDERPYGMTPPY